MQNIKYIPLAKMPLIIGKLGLEKYTAGQIVQWLYKKNATSFEEMTNLSKGARKILSENFYISRLKLVKKLQSADGTQKFAWGLEDGRIIESVLILSEPYSKVPKNQRTNALTHQRTRFTLCISTQVGCAMGCVFCRTGQMGFIRNLTQGEIVDQILEAQKQCHPLPHPPPSRGRDGVRGHRVTNVVLMGMGEPLANYDNVVNAVRIMLDSKCLGLSKRHVTISTSGLVSGIERLAEEKLEIKLAISLNATTDEARAEIMPINKKYPLASLFKALKKYATATGRNRITFEYVIIEDENDSIEDAMRLVKLLSHIPAKVNLIPVNVVPTFRSGEIAQSKDRDYRTPTEETIQRFAQYLRNKNVQVNIRISRGTDILAACGQLAGIDPFHLVGGKGSVVNSRRISGDTHF